MFNSSNKKIRMLYTILMISRWTQTCYGNCVIVECIPPFTGNEAFCFEESLVFEAELVVLGVKTLRQSGRV